MNVENDIETRLDVGRQTPYNDLGASVESYLTKCWICVCNKGKKTPIIKQVVNERTGLCLEHLSELREG